MHGMNKEVSVRAWEHMCECCDYAWTIWNELLGSCRVCNSPYWNKARVR